MKSFFAGLALAIVLAGFSIWAYDVFSVSSAARFQDPQVVHLDEEGAHPRAHQGPPPIEAY